MVSNIGTWLIHKGNMPPTVVAVVSKIGRRRCWQASKTAVLSSRPVSSISILIRSNNTIALLIIMPASETRARMVKKPNIELAMVKPVVIPIMPSGMVHRMITGLRIRFQKQPEYYLSASCHEPFSPEEISRQIHHQSTF